MDNNHSLENDSIDPTNELGLRQEIKACQAEIVYLSNSDDTSTENSDDDDSSNESVNVDDSIVAQDAVMLKTEHQNEVNPTKQIDLYDHSEAASVCFPKTGDLSSQQSFAIENQLKVNVSKAISEDASCKKSFDTDSAAKAEKLFESCQKVITDTKARRKTFTDDQVIEAMKTLTKVIEPNALDN